jgi:hypothetical protein
MDTLKVYDEWQRDKDKRYGGKYGDSGHYASKCTSNNIKGFLLPFLGVGLPVFFISGADLLSFVFAVFFGLIGAMIGMLCSNSKNIKNAKEYGIKEGNETLEREKLNQKIGIASTIATGASLYHNTKEMMKNIGNVDSWKKMK